MDSHELSWHSELSSAFFAVSRNSSRLLDGIDPSLLLFSSAPLSIDIILPPGFFWRILHLLAAVLPEPGIAYIVHNSVVFVFLVIGSPAGINPN